MNLQDLGSGTPSTKKWLNIKCNTIEAKTITADSFVGPIDVSILTLDETKGVPNPPPGKLNLFADMDGSINTTDSAGMTNYYVSNPIPVSSYAVIPQFDNVDGNQVIDSGINVALVKSSLNNASSLAPAGLRDLWQLGDLSVNGSGNSMTYAPQIDTLMSYGIQSGQISYSLNGGRTLVLSTLTPPASGTEPFVVGWNGIYFVAFSYDLTDQVYTSPDGITFTGQGVPPAGLNGFNIVWFSKVSLWVVSAYILSTNGVMTSPDGITWTFHPMFDNGVEIPFLQANNDIVVASNGGSSPQFVWSTDGINYQYTTGVTSGTGQVAIIYSPERHEFYVPGNPGFYSSDGKTWTQALGTFAADNPFIGVWASNGINGYYMASTDKAGNYSLWYTPDPNISFVNSQLDGTTILDDTTYNCVVFRTVNSSFIVGLYNETNQLAYSSPQPYAIKSVSDQIRVRGFPVNVGVYSTYGPTTVNNTAVETNISTNVSSVGTLSFQAAQPLGMIINGGISYTSTSNAGDTITFRIYCNGVELISQEVTIGALAVSEPDWISFTGVVNPGAISMHMSQYSTGEQTILTPAYNNIIQNTFSVTAQWGANLSQLSVNQLYITADFPNGP
jgi:hypothetical protein